MRLLIMGAPGAGKGTQATALGAHFGVPVISTGDIFRDNISRGTELGLKVKAIIDSGDYVPDEVTEDIVADRLSQPDCAEGFLLDGFPRTMHQVRFLDEFLGKDGHSLDAAVSLLVDPEALVERLLSRADVEGRTDDNEETIRRRMEVYAGQTAPLLSHYEEQGVMVEIDGTGSISDVQERMFAALDSLQA